MRVSGAQGRLSLGHFLGGRDHHAAELDDSLVRCAQLILGAVGDRTHRFPHCHVLDRVGLIALAVGLVTQSGGGGRSTSGIRINTKEARLVNLGLPKGTKLIRSHVADGRLILHLELPDRGAWLYIVPLDGSPVVRLAIGAQ